MGKKHSHRSKYRSYNKALITEEGIVIKSHVISHGNSTHSNPVSQDGSRKSGELGDNDDNDSNSDDLFETASVISCVTCLSDSYSSTSTTTTATSDVPYSSLNGKFPVNTVIPYGRILFARKVERCRSKRRSDSLAPTESNIDKAITKSIKDDPLNGLTEEELKIRTKLSKCSLQSLDSTGNMKTLVEITFAKPRRQDVVPKRLTFDIEHSVLSCDEIANEILERSYRGSKRNRKVLVLINPHGGKGNAKKLFMTKANPILLASRCSVEINYTEYTGHAVKIAETLDLEKYDTILCASGDGIPHEVINGLYRRKDRVDAFNKLAITEIPCGSGNAMSVSCHWTNNPSYAALSIVKGIESRVDIMCCSQPSYMNEFPRLSFLSQTYGLIAESDINTEFIRWIGSARFEIGVAFNVLQRKKYPCEIYVKYAAKTKNDLKIHYLENKGKGTLTFERNFDKVTESGSSMNETDLESLVCEDVDESNFELKYNFDSAKEDNWDKIDKSVTKNLGIFYAGKMPYIAADTKFFPAALPNDGAIDMVVTDARTAVTRMVPILLALDKGSHVLQPEVLHSKILAYKLVPKLKSSCFSIDGEKFPLEPLMVQVLPRLCKTLLRNGQFVETGFSKM